MSRDQRGSAAVETTLLVPVLLLFVALMVAGARLYLARGAVIDAAASAARAASSEVTAPAAARAAHQQVHRELDGTCAPRIDADTAQFRRPVGTAAEVTVRVRCEVFFADVLLPGMPGAITVRAEESAVLDTFRRRG